MAYRSTAWIAPLAGGIFVAYSVLLADRAPLAHFPAFAFPRVAGTMAVPLLRAEGEAVSPYELTDFVGIAADDVDVEHTGYGCSAHHQFVELQAWVREHQAGEEGSTGAVPVQVGVLLIAIEDGELKMKERIDARGWARRR